MNFIVCDVLVIGGGEAGLRAAIEARKQGVNVILVSKGTAGRAGASALAVGTHSAITLPEDSIQAFENDILKSGRNISKRSLVNILATGSSSIISDLKELGIEMVFESDLRTPGHSFHRRWHPPSRRGVDITLGLRKVFESIGGIIMDNTNVKDLIGDGRIYGAIAEHKNNNIALIAGKTILATGGLGFLYRYTDNPSDVKGEGIFMAWKHGATLIDMEFVQFYPYWLVHPRSFDIGTKLFSLGAVMRNKNGERIMDKYPAKELETRDIVSRTMSLSETVYLDVSNVPKEVIKNINPRLYRVLTSNYQNELILNPVEHYSLGGIEIDEHCQTSLQGLLACGECTGGIHGANRLGGNALTEALVFGKIAGETAANSFEIDKSIVNHAKKIVRDIGEHVETKKNKSLIVIRELVSKYLGVTRSVKGLQYLKDILDNDDVIANDSTIHEYKVLIKLIASVCLLRKESRGAHTLTDYPEQNSAFDGNFRIRLNQDLKEEIWFSKSVVESSEGEYV